MEIPDGAQMHISHMGEWVVVPHHHRSGAERIWHYTGADGLLGLLKDNCLWASATSSLNDASELHHGLSVIREAWRWFPRPSLHPIVTAVVDHIVDPLVQSRLTDSMFVVSASKNPDSLNQWQGYARNQGFAVELRATGLAHWLEKDDPQDTVPQVPLPRWSDVIYDSDEQGFAAEDLLDFIVRVIDDNVQAVEASGGFVAPREGADPDLLQKLQSHHVFVDAATRFVCGLSARMKDPAFAAEEEVRAFYWKDPALREKFRTGPRGIVPYVRLVYQPSYTPTHDRDHKLPIVGVRCGPNNREDGEAARAVVERLLHAHNVEAVVSSSEIPYRF